MPTGTTATNVGTVVDEFADCVVAVSVFAALLVCVAWATDIRLLLPRPAEVFLTVVGAGELELTASALAGALNVSLADRADDLEVSVAAAVVAALPRELLVEEGEPVALFADGVDPPVSEVSACATPAPLANAAPTPRVIAPAPSHA